MTEIRDGQRQRKIINEERFMRLKQTTRRAWSSRALRWINMMSEDLVNIDPELKASKEKLKDCIKHQGPVRGDRILWGRPMGGRAAQNEGQNDDAGHREEGWHNHEDQTQIEEERIAARGRHREALGVLEGEAAITISPTT